MSRRFLGIETDSLTFRGLSVAVLALLMLIPINMVRGVIDERYGLYQGVVQQVGSEWGGEQRVIGPVMLIPISEHWSTVETVQSESGEAKQIRRDETRDDVIALLPETLAINTSLDAERRQRGIYEAMVYTAQVALKGRFASPDLVAPPGRAIDVHWEDATLAIGISAPVGIHDVGTPLITGGARSAEPGSQTRRTAARHALAFARRKGAGKQRRIQRRPLAARQRANRIRAHRCHHARPHRVEVAASRLRRSDADTARDRRFGLQRRLVGFEPVAQLPADVLATERAAVAE